MLCFQAVLKVVLLLLLSYKKIKVHMATKAFDMRIVEPSFEVKGMFILAKPRYFSETLCWRQSPQPKPNQIKRERVLYNFVLMQLQKICLQRNFLKKDRNTKTRKWSLIWLESIPSLRTCLHSKIYFCNLQKIQNIIGF